MDIAECGCWMLSADIILAHANRGILSLGNLCRICLKIALEAFQKVAGVKAH